MLIRFSFFAVIISFSFISCNTYKQIPYFLNLPDSGKVFRNGISVNPLGKNNDIVIKPGDELNIEIFMADGSLVPIGSIGQNNQNIPQFNKVKSESIVSNNTPNYYIVDGVGCIEIPSIGKALVSDISLDSAQKLILKMAELHLRSPVVKIKIVNFTITVLGEVNNPGKYIINKTQVSLLDALGLAGDMTVYGKRNNVIVMHTNEDRSTKLIRVNLNDTLSFKSVGFYLRQNDIVYVEPTKGKAAANDASQIRTYAIISSLASLVLALIYNLRK